EPGCRLEIMAVAGGGFARANLLHDHADDGYHADPDGYHVYLTDSEIRHEAIADGAEVTGERTDVRARQHDERKPAEDQHARERHNERRYFHVGDPEPLPGADEGTREQRHQYSDPPVHAHA